MYATRDEICQFCRPYTEVYNNNNNTQIKRRDGERYHNCDQKYLNKAMNIEYYSIEGLKIINAISILLILFPAS